MPFFRAKLFLLFSCFFIFSPLAQAQLKLLKKIKGNSYSRYASVQVSPDGNFLFVSEIHHLMIWDLNTLKIKKDLTTSMVGQSFGAGVNIPYDFSSQPNWAALERNSSEVTLMNLETGQEAYHFNPFHQKLDSIRLHPSKPLIAVTSGKKLIVRNYKTDKNIIDVDLSPADAFYPYFLHNSEKVFLLSSYFSSHAFIVDPDKLIDGKTSKNTKDAIKINSLNFNPEIFLFKPNSTQFATASAGLTSVFVLDAITGMQKFKYAHNAIPTALAWHPSGDYLVSGDQGNEIKIYEVPSKKVVHTYMGSDSIVCLRFSTDGNILFSAFYNGLIKVRDFLNGKITKTFDVGKPIRYFDVSSDHTKFVIIHQNDEIGIYETGLKKIQPQKPKTMEEIQFLKRIETWDQQSSQLFQELKVQKSSLLKDLSCLNDPYKENRDHLKKLFCSYKACSLKVKKLMLDDPWNKALLTVEGLEIANKMQETLQQVDGQFSFTKTSCSTP